MSILKQTIENYKKTLPQTTEQSTKVESKFGLKLMNETIIADYAALEAKLASQVKWEFFPIPVFPGTLSVFIAPSGNGKTFFSTGMAVSLALSGEKVLFLATEESKNSLLKKTKAAGFDESHEVWANLAHYYTDNLNTETIIQLYKEAKSLGITYIMMDYAKPSVWGESGELHTKLGDLFGATLTAIEHTDITTFAMIQGNRESRGILHTQGGERRYTPHPLSFFQETPEMVDIMIDGGLAAYRSAENVFFIHKGSEDTPERHLVLCKTREFEKEKGKAFRYDVNPASLKLKLLPNTGMLFTSEGVNRDEAKKPKIGIR